MPKKQHGTIHWRGSPSIFVFATSYLLSLIGILIAYEVEIFITRDIGYPGFWNFLHYLIAQPIGSWPFESITFLMMLVMHLIILALFINILYRILQTKLMRYKLTEEQIIISRFSMMGMYNNHTELYRLIDFKRITPLAGMAFRFSNLVLQTADPHAPRLMLEGIRNGQSVLNMIRNQTEVCREKKGVRELTTGSNYTD